MDWRRSVVTGAVVGFVLAMPLFECLLLTTLAVDGGVFDATLAVQFFSRSANVLALLAGWHLVATLLGALTGLALAYRLHRRGRRPRLRVIPGGAGGRPRNRRTG